jgi:hypothetical protein
MTSTISINGWATEPTTITSNVTSPTREASDQEGMTAIGMDREGLQIRARGSRSEGAQGGLDPEQILDNQEGPSVSQFRGCLDGMGASLIKQNLTEPNLSE